jgi:putative endopeptidase
MRLFKKPGFVIGLLASSAFAATCAVAAEKPHYGEYGFDAAGMGANIKPGDNFYDYVNGTWQKTMVIPPDRSNYGMFTALNDQSQKDTREIIESTAKAGGAPGTDAQKVADAYRSFMNTEAIEKKGLAPVQPLFADIAKVKSRDELVSLMAKLRREQGVRTPIALSVEQDSKHPDRYWADLSQSGLGMRNRSLTSSARAIALTSKPCSS